MKSNYVLAACSAVLVVGLAIFATAPARAQDGIKIEPTERSKWDYKVIIPKQEGPDLHEGRRAELEQELLTLGEEGWELVEMPYLKGVRYQVMILKRPKQQ
ncbi:MAG: hypothetical protein LCH41_00570 [Armatimonadetes bacterium]|nr:hypothetical protein [Armatimonadota bacterium]